MGKTKRPVRGIWEWLLGEGGWGAGGGQHA